MRIKSKRLTARSNNYIIKKGRSIATSWVYVILISAFLVSCGSKKAAIATATESNLSAKQIIRNHYRNDADFETLRGRIKIDYADDHTSQGFSVSMRMKKDEAIWLSATLSVVKVLITPDRVSFYNKLDNTYFDGDYALLNKLLGTEVNYTMVQNLLLGQSILDLKDQRFDASVSSDYYQLTPNRQQELYKLLFLLEPRNFKMAVQQLSQPEKGRILNIAYESYQQVEGIVVPDKISLEAQDGTVLTKIDLEYRSLEFNERLSFPYNIPNGFTPIELDR
ncbi:DUF4292 domain-containing protein [Robertkochia marina]|uniref:DUF4292 domain-containing protein n=1 Tax=Robertkochia marina TaxID=1227945 RepID=A0A4S3M2R8_9FLAO|nr:DUF4292 domain-containing protein [Robertkochia marina]TRZ47374.1 DUF4292 domain-containing protein [Robertkochia marina]